MITVDDALQNCKDFTNDSTSQSATFFSRLLNEGYKYVLNAYGRPNTEHTYTVNTNAPSSPLVYSDRVYQLPPDFLFHKTVTIQIGSQRYPLVEEESQEMWDFRTRVNQSGIPSLYFLRPRFGIGGAEILFDPIPSASGYTLTVVYEATDADLNQVGVSNATNPATLTFTQTNTSVTSNNSVFTTSMNGSYIKTTDGDGLWYRIQQVNNGTTLTLENYYQATTISSTNGWTINQIFALPEDAQQLPVYYTLWHYYMLKKDPDMTQYFQTTFQSELQASRDRWATKSRSAIVRSKNYLNRWRVYPLYFPPGGISS